MCCSDPVIDWGIVPVPWYLDRYVLDVLFTASLVLFINEHVNTQDCIDISCEVCSQENSILFTAFSGSTGSSGSVLLNLISLLNKWHLSAEESQNYFSQYVSYDMLNLSLK